MNEYIKALYEYIYKKLGVDIVCRLAANIKYSLTGFGTLLHDPLVIV